LDRINCVWFGGRPLSFNDGEVVVVDGEYEVGITRYRDNTESIPFTFHDIDDREVDLWATWVSALTIDQGRVCLGNTGDIYGKSMVPERSKTSRKSKD